MFKKVKTSNFQVWAVLLMAALLFSACTNVDHRNKSSQTHSKSHSSYSHNCPSPYKVRSGQTLSGIANRCDVDMDRLADLNGITPPYQIYIGQELLIPGSRKTKSSKPSSTYTPLKTVKFAWPMKQKEHEFVADSAGKHVLLIKANIGEGVYAAEAGEVVYAGDGIQHFGKMVMIKHDDNYLTIYAHNNSIVVKESQMVTKGQLISTVGSTGSVKSPQLYVEVRYRGRKVDAKPLFVP